MAEFYGSGKEFGSSYDSQTKMSFKAFEIAPVIERIVTTSADRPKTVGLEVLFFAEAPQFNLICSTCLLIPL